MNKYLTAIHKAIGGDYTDVNPAIEDAAVELAMRLEWHHDSEHYLTTATKQIDALVSIPNTDSIRADIAGKIAAHRPYDINAVQEIIDSGAAETIDYSKLLSAE